jgi:hypothetical protein
LYDDHPAIDSAAAWQKLIAWLPGVVEQLLASPAYNLEARPPADRRGIYLFSEDGGHLYVGRTGITRRTRGRGLAPTTSFRSRFDQHTQPGQPPWSAPFAARLAHAEAAAQGLQPVTGWWKTRHNEGAEMCALFTAAKARVGQMEMRVAAFDDDERGVRSAVAELYAHVVLGTPYNDFSTS